MKLKVFKVVESVFTKEVRVMHTTKVLYLFLLFVTPCIGQTQKGKEPNSPPKSEAQVLSEVKKFLENGGDINSTDEEGATLLERAIIEEHKDVAKFLIIKGANVNAGGEYCGAKPLHLAAGRGQREIVELLLLKGADINARGTLKETPLHWAAQYGHKDVVELLLSKGADPNVTDGIGGIPLHYAKKYDIIETLIAGGSNVNARSSTGSTPLHNMVRDHYKVLGLKKPTDKETIKKTKEVVELLLRKGADVNIKDKSGKTPLCLAKEAGDLEIIELLKKHGAAD